MAWRREYLPNGRCGANLPALGLGNSIWAVHQDCFPREGPNAAERKKAQLLFPSQ